MVTSSLRDIRALPKAHLHLHLTGSMRLGTLHEFAAAYQIALPPALRNTSVSWADADRDWSVFQARYDAARNAIRSMDDLRRVIRETAEDDAADGSGWLELQVDPTSYAVRFGGFDGVVEVLLQACRDAAAATGVGIGLIVATSWARSGEHASTLARLAARYAGRGVVGFGISGDERCCWMPVCRSRSAPMIRCSWGHGWQANTRSCVTPRPRRRAASGPGPALDRRLGCPHGGQGAPAHRRRRLAGIEPLSKQGVGGLAQLTAGQRVPSLGRSRSVR